MHASARSALGQSFRATFERGVSEKLSLRLFKNGQWRISSMMPANAQGIVAAATMEPTAVLPPDVRAAPCDDDGETLILYPLTTPNGSARYELPESIQHACNAHTPPTKVPSAQQKVSEQEGCCNSIVRHRANGCVYDRLFRTRGARSSGRFWPT